MSVTQIIKHTTMFHIHILHEEMTENIYTKTYTVPYMRKIYTLHVTIYFPKIIQYSDLFTHFAQV